MQVKRFDRGTIKKPTRTSQGFLKADTFPTRIGVFIYHKPDGSVVRELRHPDEVFKADSLETLKSIPVTDDHPSEFVNSENVKKYQRGFTSDAVEKDGDFVKASLTITHKDLIEKIDSGKVENSCGYYCDLDFNPGEYNGEAYDCIQRNIIYNHLAIVDKGRAGPEARLRLDSANNAVFDEEEKPKPQEGKITMTKIKIDSVDYEVSEVVATVISDKLKKLDEMQRELDTVKGRHDALQTEKKQKEDEIEKLKKSAPSVEQLRKMAKDRAELEEVAKKFLKDEKFDSMSDLEIKKSVIKSTNKDLNLDEKSEDYITGFFDLARQSLSEKNPITEALRSSVGKNDESSDYESIRAKRMKEDSEAWMKPISGAVLK